MRVYVVRYMDAGLCVREREPITRGERIGASNSERAESNNAYRVG